MSEAKTNPVPEPSLRDLFEYMEGISEAVAEVKVSLDCLQNVPEAVRLLGSTVVEHYTRVTERLDGMQRRFDDIEGRLATVENRISILETVRDGDGDQRA